jgi:hypothetical protein
LKKLLWLLLCMPLAILPFGDSDAAILGFADSVDEYYYSGSADPQVGPYGGWYIATGTTYGSRGTVGQGTVITDVVLGDDPTTDRSHLYTDPDDPGSDPDPNQPYWDFLSLPAGSYVTVSFTDETIIDGNGNDFVIRESGPGYEEAEIWVSSDGSSFISLGTVESVPDPNYAAGDPDRPFLSEFYFDLEDF